MEVFQVVIAVVASIVFFVFAGLTFAGSAVALTVTTPLFIIFSPILVPATIATAVLTTGFTASGTLGATAIALVRRRMGLKPKHNIPPIGAPPTLFVGSSPAQTLFQMPKISYDGTFKGSWGGSSSAQTLPNISYGGSWTASWGGRSISGTFGDKSAGGNTPALAGGSTPEAAGGSTPAPAPAGKSTPPG